MGSSSRTYYGLEVVPVTEDYEQGYTNTMLNVYKQIFNGPDVLIDTLGRSIATNRAIFNDAYLTAMGYNPNETVSYRVTDGDAVLGWAQANVDSDITAVHEIGTTYPENERFALQYMFDTFTDFNYYAKTATLPDGHEYTLTGTTNNGSLFSLTLLQEASVAVDAYVAANHDGTYSVLEYGNLHTDLLGDNYWKTTLLHTITEDPLETEEVVIEVPAVFTTEEFANPLASLQAQVVSTYNKSFEVEVAQLFWVPDEGNEGQEAPTAFRATATLTTVVTGPGRFEVVSSYEVTLGEGLADYYYEQAEAVIAASRADYQSEVDAFVVSQVQHFYFLYDTPTETFRPFLQDSAMPTSLTKLESAGAFPIVPLKRRGSMIGNTTNRKAILGKVGLHGDEFDSTVSDKDVYSAYFMFGVELGDTSSPANKYLFEAINNLASKVTTSGQDEFGKVTTYKATGMRVWFQGLDVVTSLGDVDSKLIPGSIGPLGSYSASTDTRTRYYTVWEERGDDGRVEVEKEEQYKVYYKRKQVSDNFYQEIEIVRGFTDYIIDGKANTGEPPLIPVVKYAMDKIPFKDYMYLLIKSMQLVIFTKVTITTKWYRSGLFKFVMLAVSIVLAVVSFGTTSPWTAGLLIAVSMAGYVGLLQGTLGTVISIATMAFGGYQALTTSGMDTTVRTLALASTTVNLVGVANQIQIYGVDGKSGQMGKIVEESEDRDKELDESTKLAKEVEEGSHAAVMMPEITHKYPDAMYSMALGDVGYNYDVLCNYDSIYSQSMVPDLT